MFGILSIIWYVSLFAFLQNFAVALIKGGGWEGEMGYVKGDDSQNAYHLLIKFLTRNLVKNYSGLLWACLVFLVSWCYYEPYIYNKDDIKIIIVVLNA